MSRLLKQLLAGGGYMDAADDGTDGGPGGSTGSGNDGNDGNDGSGGKKFTDDEAAALLKENMRRKANEKKLADDLKAAQEALKQFDGIDVAKVKDLLAAEAKREEEKVKLEEEALAKKGEWERLKAQMAEAHAAEKKTLSDQVKALSDQVSGFQSTIGELTVGNAFGNSKFIAEELILTPAKARIVYGGHFEFKDGQLVGFDKPTGAKDRTVLVGSSGDPLPFEEALKKIITADVDYESIAKSKLKQGAGSGGKGSDGAPDLKPELHGASKIAAALAAQKGKK